MSKKLRDLMDWKVKYKVKNQQLQMKLAEEKRQRKRV